MSYYKALLDRKRSWTPIVPTPAPVTPGAETTIGRALALRCLEIPVGDFITAATRRDLPKDDYVLTLLQSNIADEERHDQALQNAENALGLAKPYEEEAQRIKKIAIEMTEHPVLKALTLERGVFFVLLPIFRFLGNAGLRTIASDISLDETAHVSTHSLVCSDLNIQLTRKLDKVRKEVVAWMVSDLDVPGSKFGNKDFWIRQSDNLMYTGSAKELEDTGRARMPAFFESNSNNLPEYY
ncbi:ferritin-like domain-containing protein [Calothrix membranacea FACHB-236]|nr:ferritin-like domain-containing protein [Calothrix membranacea FACHB-236]